MGIDVKDKERTFKAASLMGPRSGLPSVVDSDGGKITRIRPMHYEDYVEWESLNPYKVEARGKTFCAPKKSLPGIYYLSYKKRVYSNNRVMWPLKRVDWDPDGERNPGSRGKSRYVRITWDEATDIIAKEIARIKEKYGMSAVLAEADMHGEGKHVAPSHGCMNRLLALLGGYTVQMRNADSWEGWTWGSKHVWGGEPVGQLQPSGNVWPDIANHAETLLFWAADPETTSPGFEGYVPSRLSYWIHSLGHKFIHIDPALNYSGVCQADKWIPVLPNTDAALGLAICYVWLTEGSYDKDYVKTHAVGTEPFFEYVLGNAGDGVPKTPKWASGKCGVPSYTIKALARHWAKHVTSLTIGNGGPGIRGPYSHEHCRIQSILLSMQGLAKPGRHLAKWLEWSLMTADFAMPYKGEEVMAIPHRAELVRPAGAVFDEEMIKEMNKRGMSDVGAIDAAEMARRLSEKDYGFAAVLTQSEAMKKVERLVDITNPIATPPSQSVPKCMVHDAILKDSIEWYGLWSFCGPVKEQWDRFVFPEKNCSRIHMVWTDSPCMVTCWNDGYNFVKALQSEEIEFVVAQHPWLENDCYMADLILPVQTKFEMEDISDDLTSGGITSVFHERPACPPVGESLNDFDCVAEVARKIGEDVYMRYTADGTTSAECIDLFWQGSGVAHLDKDDSFHKKGIFFIPVKENLLEDVPPGFRPFADDPENNPLKTPTGKLEFTSTGLSGHFPDDGERPPYPVWIEKGECHDESLSSGRAKDYPLLLMSNHGRWRFHANLDDVTWHREIETMKIRAKDGYQYEPAWMNPETAAGLGIEHHDIIKVYNERGTVLCAAYVTERVVPRVVYVDHGSRFDPIDPLWLDRGGAINLISPHANISKNATGMVVSGYLVAAAKVTDAEMDMWRERYPEAFSREVDQDCGVCLGGWLQEG
ncbi:MAG: molybdopterin-dependent oxidoreductase [Clostridiales bacterium]|nr:molybdopterin-dependent oxidoreductase [Clostridiales bacterium]